MPTHNYSHMPAGYSRMPNSLLARLRIICEVSEAIINDQPEALHIAHIHDIRNLAMGALNANEYEDAEMRIAGLIDDAEKFVAEEAREHEAGKDEYNIEPRAFGWQP